jgi:hypothetical protein
MIRLGGFRLQDLFHLLAGANLLQSVRMWRGFGQDHAYGLRMLLSGPGNDIAFTGVADSMLLIQTRPSGSS